jgi:hypothetical protein
MIPFIGALLSTVTSGVVEHFKDKRKIKAAITENKIRLAQDQQNFNQDWEMKQLDNAGWKDEALFIAIIAMYLYSAFDPVGAAAVFANWELIPEWFRTITMWMVAGIVGVKKIGDYLPGAIKGIKEAVKK